MFIIVWHRVACQPTLSLANQRCRLPTNQCRCSPLTNAFLDVAHLVVTRRVKANVAAPVD